MPKGAFSLDGNGFDRKEVSKKVYKTSMWLRHAFHRKQDAIK